MDGGHVHADWFFHVRVIIGIVTGLSVARLLNGLARFVQHPRLEQVYIVHLGWVLYLLLSVVHFWWFEYRLSSIDRWTFEVYAFILFYAALFFFTCSVLFPDSMEEYANYRHYFHSRQRWFYGLLATLFLLDMADTALKGTAHFQSLGLEYPIRQSLLASMAIIAMFVKAKAFHVLFVCACIAWHISWIVRQFDVLG